MSYGTAATNISGTSLTLEGVEKMLKELQGVPPALWVLIAPNGDCFTGADPMALAEGAKHQHFRFDPFAQMSGSILGT